MVAKNIAEINKHFADAGKKQFTIRVSHQAMILMKKIDGFDLAEFETWWVKNHAMVGGAHVLSYLSQKDRTEEPR